MNNQKLANLIDIEIDKILPNIIELRHSIHSEPEIAGKEFKTQKKILEIINKTSFTAEKPLLGTDVIVNINTNNNKTIGLRADIDALPLIEKTEISYKSKIDGMMHACGHDGHAAILSGTALVLGALKELLKVNVRLVFQPGEESEALGKDLVELGCASGVDEFYALHALPARPLGQIATKEGVLFAAGSHFSFKFIGKGCHGAMPHKGINPLPALAKATVDLYELHKKINNESGSVVSVCAIEAESSETIIRDDAILKGTARYTDPKMADVLEKQITEIVNSSIKNTGLKIETKYHKKYSLPVVNSTFGFKKVRDIAKESFSDNTWQEETQHTMGMEDFSFFLNKREGAMFWLGQGENIPPLHNPCFNFNDESIKYGIKMMCMIVLGSK